MKILLTVLLLLLATPAFSQASAQQGSPTWIVETFFTSAAFPDADKYYSGEMTRFLTTPPMGAYRKAGYKSKLTVLFESDTAQVHRFTYSESPQSGDWYAFLAKADDGWKLTAVRTLAIPKFVHELRARLAKQSVRTEAESRELSKMNLLFSSDADLKAYALEKRPDLIALATEVLKGSPKETWSARLEMLACDQAELSPRGFVQITIGGVLDNSAGFIFAPKEAATPKMDPENFILIEDLGEGWFLFKTT